MPASPLERAANERLVSVAGHSRFVVTSLGGARPSGEALEFIRSA